MLNYPNHALYVYRLNTDVNDHNSHMLNALAPKSQQYSIKARDSMAGQTDHQTCLTNNQRLVAFTVSLKQQFGPDLMLATDVDVSDGLINGAGGEVVHVVTSNDNKVTHILVTFDNPDVGAKGKASTKENLVNKSAKPDTASMTTK